eukprot:403373713
MCKKCRLQISLKIQSKSTKSLKINQNQQNIKKDNLNESNINVYDQSIDHQKIVDETNQILNKPSGNLTLYLSKHQFQQVLNKSVQHINHSQIHYDNEHQQQQEIVTPNSDNVQKSHDSNLITIIIGKGQIQTDSDILNKRFKVQKKQSSKKALLLMIREGQKAPSLQNTSSRNINSQDLVHKFYTQQQNQIQQTLSFEEDRKDIHNQQDDIFQKSEIMQQLNVKHTIPQTLIQLSSAEIKRMSNIQEEQSEEAEDTNSKIVMNRSKTQQKFSPQSSHLDTSSLSTDRQNQNDQNKYQDQIKSSQFHLQKVEQRISVLSAFKKQYSSISELKTQQSLRSLPRTSLGMFDQSRLFNQGPRYSNISGLTVPESIQNFSHSQSPTSKLHGGKVTPLINQLQNKITQNEFISPLLGRGSAKPPLTFGFSSMYQDRKINKQQTDQIIIKPGSKIDMSKRSLKNTTTVITPILKQMLTKHRSSIETVAEVEDEHIKDKKLKNRKTKTFYVAQQQTLPGRNQSQFSKGGMLDVGSGQTSDPQIRSTYMQAQFLKKLHHEDNDINSNDNQLQRIADNPVSALNLDKNSDAYKQIVFNPKSYSDIKKRIKIQRQQKLLQNELEDEKIDKFDDDFSSQKSHDQNGHPKTLQVTRKKNLIKQLLTKKLCSTAGNSPLNAKKPPFMITLPYDPPRQGSESTKNLNRQSVSYQVLFNRSLSKDHRYSHLMLKNN